MKPRVIIFNSISLDGRIEFNSEEANEPLYYKIAASWNADAMLSGSSIISAFPPDKMPDPEIFNPPAEYHPLAVPLLIAVDSRGRIRNWNYMRSQPFFKKVAVFCSKSTPRDYLDYLDRLQIEHIIAGENQVDLKEGLEAINVRFGINSIRVDAGGTLNGALLCAGLVDEFSVLLDPCLVGGTAPGTVYKAPDPASAEETIKLRLMNFEQISDNVLWLRYEVIKK